MSTEQNDLLERYAQSTANMTAAQEYSGMLARFARVSREIMGVNERREKKPERFITTLKISLAEVRAEQTRLDKWIAEAQIEHDKLTVLVNEGD